MTRSHSVRPKIAHTWAIPSALRSWPGIALLIASAAAGPLAQAAEPSAPAAGASPVGYWTTIDDDGKTPKAVVNIVANQGKLSGRIVKLMNPKEKDPKCRECEGAKHNQPIVGLEIMWGLKKDGDEWSGGHILDPDNGKEYKCYVEVIDGGKQLQVRGYIGIALLGRTQYWRRATAPAVQ
jgi:uncharacterized protein (DUF2147 family)